MITLWMLGVTLIVMFVGWFSVTMWTGSSQRRQLAAAADQAAQAGATALDADAFRQQRRPPARPGAGRAAGRWQPRRARTSTTCSPATRSTPPPPDRRRARGRGRRRPAAHLRRRRRPDPGARHRRRLPPRRSPMTRRAPRHRLAIVALSLLAVGCSDDDRQPIRRPRRRTATRRRRRPTDADHHGAADDHDADHDRRRRRPRRRRRRRADHAAADIAADDWEAILEELSRRRVVAVRGAGPVADRRVLHAGRPTAPPQLETQLGDAIAKGQHIEGQQPSTSSRSCRRSIGEPTPARPARRAWCSSSRPTARRRRGWSTPPATSSTSCH